MAAISVPAAMTEMAKVLGLELHGLKCIEFAYSWSSGLPLIKATYFMKPDKINDAVEVLKKYELEIKPITS